MATAQIKASFVRPANTTLYTIGDAIAPAAGGAVTEIPGVAAAANGIGTLFAVQCTTNMPTCQGQLRLHFWSTNSLNASTLITDNAVFPLILTDEATYGGYVDIQSFATEDATGTMAIAQQKDLSFPLTADATANKSAWFQVECKNGAFTPVSGQTFKFTFWVIQ